jgi:hypothetical protein
LTWPSPNPISAATCIGYGIWPASPGGNDAAGSAFSQREPSPPLGALPFGNVGLKQVGLSKGLDRNRTSQNRTTLNLTSLSQTDFDAKGLTPVGALTRNGDLT